MGFRLAVGLPPGSARRRSSLLAVQALHSLCVALAADELHDLPGAQSKPRLVPLAQQHAGTVGHPARLLLRLFGRRVLPVVVASNKDIRRAGGPKPRSGMSRPRLHKMIWAITSHGRQAAAAVMHILTLRR